MDGSFDRKIRFFGGRTSREGTVQDGIASLNRAPCFRLRLFISDRSNTDSIEVLKGHGDDYKFTNLKIENLGRDPDGPKFLQERVVNLPFTIRFDQSINYDH